MKRVALQVSIQLSISRNNTDKQTNNSIPYNIKELRKLPQNADTKLQSYLQQFDSSYTNHDIPNLDNLTIIFPVSILKLTILKT